MHQADIRRRFVIRSASREEHAILEALERETWDDLSLPYDITEIPPFAFRFTDATCVLGWDPVAARAVGFGIIQPYPGQSSTAHVAILQVIGVLREYRGNGLGRRLGLACLNHPDILRFSKVVGYICSENDKSQAMVRALGFKVEGRQAGFFNIPSGPADNIIVGWSRPNEGMQPEKSE